MSQNRYILSLETSDSEACAKIIKDLNKGPISGCLVQKARDLPSVMAKLHGVMLNSSEVWSSNRNMDALSNLLKPAGKLTTGPGKMEVLFSTNDRFLACEHSIIFHLPWPEIFRDHTNKYKNCRLHMLSKKPVPVRIFLKRDR